MNCETLYNIDEPVEIESSSSESDYKLESSSSDDSVNNTSKNKKVENGTKQSNIENNMEIDYKKEDCNQNDKTEEKNTKDSSNETELNNDIADILNSAQMTPALKKRNNDMNHLSFHVSFPIQSKDKAYYVCQVFMEDHFLLQGEFIASVFRAYADMDSKKVGLF